MNEYCPQAEKEEKKGDLIEFWCQAREGKGREGKEEEAMSGGIARGRLAEERKAWRKNHPHVPPPTLLLSVCFSPSFEPSILVVFEQVWCDLLIRVSIW